MPIPGRKPASLVLLLVLAAGLAAAGGAAATGAQEMACCPATMDSGCTWLGAGDCCPERPAAPASTQAATPAPAACCALTLPALTGSLPTHPPHATVPRIAPRSLVLRL